MGIHSDIDDLLVKSSRERRQKWIRAVITSVGTIIGTTGTVAWQMSAYIARAEARDKVLRDDLLVIDKKLEVLDHRELTIEKELRAGIHDAAAAADRALLYAQLTGKGKP